MGYDWGTTFLRPFTMRRLEAETNTVLGSLLGVEAPAPGVIFGDPPDPPNRPDPTPCVPLDRTQLDLRLDPDAEPGNVDHELISCLAFLNPPMQAAYIFVNGNPEGTISAIPYRNDVSIVLAVAIAIAASRLTGDGIGDASLLFGDRSYDEMDDPADQEALFAYLREPARRHRDVESAVEAILAKTWLTRHHDRRT